MLSMDNEIITCNSTKSNDVKEIEKAIEKLKVQEKRLVDLYLSSTLDVETINHKNEVIKKEIDKLTKKKTTLDPDNSSNCLLYTSSSSGSGDFAGNVKDSLEKQFDDVSAVLQKKWPGCKYIAYFQANSNTSVSYTHLDVYKRQI